MAGITLKTGSTGPDVTRLQQLLNDRLSPNPSLKVSGTFDEETVKAVKRFQQEKGLGTDGIVGGKTWEALEAKPANVAQVAKPESPAAAAQGSSPRWMEIAMREQGQAEVAEAGKDNPRILEYHQATSLRATSDETPWCSSFVNWVMRQSGHPGTQNALASSWLTWGEKLAEPRYGAIAIIRSKSAAGNAATGSSTGYHVGFLVEQTDKAVRLLGGNQSDSVKVSSFPLEKYTLEGYRWPV
jgi:uncharacterized protein (TIGR02594 family)